MMARDGISRTALPLLLCALLTSSPTFGGISSTFGAATFVPDSESGSVRVKTLPRLESVTAIPPALDADAADALETSCSVRATRVDGDVLLPVYKAKGRYTTYLAVLDHLTGTFERTEIGSGRFATGRDGVAQFSVELPPEILAESPESGDRSIRSSTTVRFTNNRRTSLANVSCAINVVSPD